MPLSLHICLYTLLKVKTTYLAGELLMDFNCKLDLRRISWKSKYKKHNWATLRNYFVSNSI